MTVIARFFVLLILAWATAHAQHTDILGSDYPANSLATLNAKPAVRTGTSDPTGNCKAGLDLYVRTDTAELFYCGTLNVWAKSVNTSGTYPNPAWISSLAWAKITGAPSYQLASEKGAANGYASLNASSLIPLAQMCTGTGLSAQYCDPVTRAWTNIPSGSGESTTGSNLSGTGARLFSSMVGFDLQFRRANPTHNLLAITENGNVVDFTIVPANFDLSTLGGTLGLTQIGGGASGNFLRHNGANWVGAALVAGDIPVLDTSKITTGILSRARGGAGVDLTLTGGTNHVLKQGSLNGAITSGPVAAAEVTGLATVATSGSASDLGAGVLASARGGAGTINGLVKANGSGTTSQAVAGTDYVVPAGNVATATALAANPTNCTAGQAAGGVSANGTAEDCFTPAAALTVELDGATIGTRSNLNVRSETGGGVTLGCADDALNGKVTCGWQINRGTTDTWYLQPNVPNTMGTAGKLDGRAMPPADGWGIPTAPTVAPTTNGYVAFGSNDLDLFAGRNGATEPLAWRDTSVAPLLISRANASSTGTTANLLAKLNASAQAVLAATSDTTGMLGVVVSGAGTTGTAKIATVGTVACVADNSTTVGNFVIIGTSTAGRCRDGGSTYPTSGQVLGRWLSAVSAGSSGTVLLFGLGQQGVTTGGSGDVVGPASSTNNNIALFDGTTGKLLKDAGKGVPSGAIVGTSDAQTLTGKTLDRPIISTHTIASPPSSPTTGQIVLFTDALAAGNCTTGAGSALALCRWSGSTYVAVGDGGGSSTSYYYLAARTGNKDVGSGETQCWRYPDVTGNVSDCSGAQAINDSFAVMRDMRLTKVRFNVIGTQPSSGSMVCGVQDVVANSFLSIQVTIPANANHANDTYYSATGNVAITDGAALKFKCVNSATATSIIVRGTFAELATP